MKLAIDERRGFSDVLVLWVPRIVLAVAFFAIGRAKFDATGIWPRVFAQIGFGQWFRYFTGGVQVLGALFLLSPSLAFVGAVLLACTMAGAVLTQLLVFHSPAALIPAVLLGIVVAVGLGALPQRVNAPTEETPAQ
jgi:hypothetical protein